MPRPNLTVCLQQKGQEHLMILTSLSYRLKCIFFYYDQVQIFLFHNRKKDHRSGQMLVFMTNDSFVDFFVCRKGYTADWPNNPSGLPSKCDKTNRQV